MENGEEERIYVSVRLRPLNSKEISRNDVSDWDCINDDKTIVFKINNNVGILSSERSSIYPTAYTFDRVFRSDCSTREVYEQGAKDVAISVVSGINSSVFAYGQTSSGKTYTMTGITEYAIADIYDYMHKCPERDFILKFSAMEIYNESVRDLLSEDATQLRLLDDPERGTIVEKLTDEIVRDWDHVIQLLSICKAQRQIGETSLNETSSRSHQIIRLTIESSSREFLGRDNASMLSATVNFVDLAGSERASQSLSAGTRLKEGCHINRSLLTLGTVIRKLSKGRNGHIPYRDSKLTRILQTSLGGNARTAIICTMSPARTHVEQSRNTLLFASCAKEVTTSAHVNVVMSDKALIKHLQKELARLESGSDQTNPGSPNYSALLREKDLQIQKLENEVKDLILQRDVALSQVNDLLQMLGDESRSTSTLQAGLEEYPHLRVQNSPDAEIALPQQLETSKLADPPQTCSDDHFLEENFVNINATPRILISSSSSSSSSSSRSRYSYRVSEEEEEAPSEEDLCCREVRCIEPSNTQDVQSNYEANDDDMLDGLREVIVMEEKQSISPTFNSEEEKGLLLTSHDISKRDKESRSIDYLHIKKLSSRDDRDTDLFGNRNSRLVKSKSCNASITKDSANSPWLRMMGYTENTPPSIGSDSEGIGRREIYPLNVVERLSSKDIIQSPPAVNGSVDKDDDPNEVNKNPVMKKNVKDVGLDPIIEENETRGGGGGGGGLSSWPVEFKRLQKEIIQLWDACNIALVHRTYFFLLFQGDPTDAIYLEVEIRRMKFLKDKFSQGNKAGTILNGKRLTLASSAKALRQERRMLSEQLMKKFSEQERESLFVKWGINLKTKFRRLQLANILWSNTQDMKHIEESAYLVAKLVGFIEPGQTPNKDMFGLNFAPRTTSNLSGISSFKTSLVSIF